MTNFLDVGLRNAARGFHVHPLHPFQPGKSEEANKICKRAILPGWPSLATTDEGIIRGWAAQWPDANAGVVAGQHLAIVESDHLPTLEARLGFPIPECYRVQANRDRPHCYFLWTERAGSSPVAGKSVAGVFEFKIGHFYVVSEGSTHPNGNTYQIIGDVPLYPIPDELVTALERIKSEEVKEVTPGAVREKIREGGRRNALVQEAGSMRRAVAVSQEVLFAHLLEFNALWCEPLLSDEEVEGVAAGCNWETETLPARVSIGKAAAPPEPAALPERNRPVYPIEVWDGTVVGEFVKLCTVGNNIPGKLFAESFRCVLGAVVGDRLSCPVEGALPRTFTINIVPKGKGKGTAIRWSVHFFHQTWSGRGAVRGTVVSETPGFLFGERESIWKPRGIGAWIAAASSVPGMVRLTKDLESTIKTKTHMSWGSTLPRILSVHEEMKTFLSALFIGGGVGTGLEGVVCQLWDDVTFNGTATGQREAAYGEMRFSLLCGVTEEDWFDILSQGNAVGGGLMSRLNLVGSEGGYANVSKLNRPDFTELQEAFLPRVRQLEDVPVRILPSADADKVISDWQETLPEGSERMNVHAWRSVLLLAWLRHEDIISTKTAEDAVRLGRYQIASHEYYRVKAADNDSAKAQGKIVRALTVKGPLKRRELQQYTHAHRVGTFLWNQALDGLLRDRTVGKGEDGRYFLAGDEP